MKALGALSLAMLALIGCSDFITLAPVDTVSADDLYETETDFADAVIGVYAPFRAEYQSRWQYGDLRGSDVWDELVKATSRDFDQFTVTSDLGIFNDTWTRLYEAITRANRILVEIEDADASIVVNKDRHTGEARFLRALAYFDLVRIFGDVPKIAQNPTPEEAMDLGRDDVTAIYDEIIIPDLLDAVARLPIAYSGTDVGRVTKGAATALLGKVYLTRQDFANAEETLRKVTALGYALVDTFERLWDYQQSEHHSEYIFDIEYESGMNIGSNFANNFAPRNTELGQHFGIVGSLNDNLNPTREFMDLWDPNDLRKQVSVADGYTLDDGTFVPLIPTSNSVSTFTMKYLTPVTTDNDSPANWKVIRYADVLLMLAEALNENGKTAEAHQYINQVRERAGLQPLDGLTQQQFREAVELERRFELFAEGHRWFDLIRTGRALKVMEPHGMQPYMSVFPIPLSQIEVMNNPEIFPQNPGYN